MIYYKKNNQGKYEKNIKKSFKLEKDIQNLVEENLKTFFDLELIKSEFSFKKTRFDTLCFDERNSTFVIIEYKRNQNYSVIDQGYTYLSLLLNNKADFVLSYNEILGKKLKKEKVDWSQARIIFISPEFSFYQKTAINFKNIPFELYEITSYDDGIGLKKLRTNSEVDISSTFPNGSKINKIKKVQEEILKYDEDYHLNKNKRRPENVKNLYFILKEKILEIDNNIVPVFKKTTIGFKLNRIFADLIIYNGGVIIHLNIKYGTINDPRNLIEDVSEKGHWGSGDCKIYFKKTEDLDYIIGLIKHSYENQKWDKKRLIIKINLFYLLKNFCISRKE